MSSVPINLSPEFERRRDEMWQAVFDKDHRKAAELGAAMLQDSFAFDAIHVCGITLPHLGQDLRDQGYDYACASLSLCKPVADWYVNAALSYTEQKLYVHAMRFLVNGLEAFPKHKTMLYMRGLIMCHTLDYAAGIDCFDEVLAEYPDFYHAQLSRGYALHMLGRYDEAMACYAAIEPITEGSAHEDVVNNISCLLTELGRRDEAMAILDEKCRDPDRPGTLYNKSFLWLGQGKWPEAWKLNRLRHKVQVMGNQGVPEVNRPLADTLDDIKGKHLFLAHEQGAGDGIMFLRYAPILRPMLSKLTVGVPPSMERLARRLIIEGDYDVITHFDRDAPPPCDFWAPMMDIPALLDQRTDNIPGERYFLPVPDALIAKRSIGQRDGRVRVGLVWAGASRRDNMRANAIDRRRSVPYELLEPLLELHERVDFVSLQQPDNRVNDRRIYQPISADYDYLDTAAVIAQLDLVITIDSSVCHLAAALETPTWMLNRWDGCWRWLWRNPVPDKYSSDWYPRSLTVYQQQTQGDWQGVIERVRGALISQLP